MCKKHKKNGKKMPGCQQPKSEKSPKANHKAHRQKLPNKYNTSVLCFWFLKQSKIKPKTHRQIKVITKRQHKHHKTPEQRKNNNKQSQIINKH